MSEKEQWKEERVKWISEKKITIALDELLDIADNLPAPEFHRQCKILPNGLVLRARMIGKSSVAENTNMFRWIVSCEVMI